MSAAVYGGLATYGKINVIIGSVISGIIVIALLIFGANLVLKKDKQTELTEGSVTNVQVIQLPDGKTSVTYTIIFNVNNKIYTIPGSGTSVMGGQIVSILYDPANPSDARIASSLSSRTTGWILISFGIIIAIITGLYLYFTLKYKEFAAIGGGLTAASQISNIIRN